MTLSRDDSGELYIMAVQLIKTLLVISWFSLFSSALADDGQEGSSGLNSQIESLVTLRMAESIVSANNAIRLCEEKARGRILPGSLFDEIDISDDDIRSVVFYFYLKARNNCVRDSVHKFLEAVYLIEEAGMLNKGIEVEGILLEGSGADMASLVMTGFGMELEYRARYLSLPEDLRNRIESLGVFHQPFDMGKSAKNLGVLR